MTFYAIYQTEDGRYVSGTDDLTKIASQDILTARGYAMKVFPDMAGTNGFVWNPATLAFDAAPVNTVLSRIDFMLRLTVQERIGIRQSADPVVVDFLDLLSHADTVDLANPETQAGVNYLASVNLLSADRAKAIMTP